MGCLWCRNWSTKVMDMAVLTMNVNVVMVMVMVVYVYVWVWVNWLVRKTRRWTRTGGCQIHFNSTGVHVWVVLLELFHGLFGSCVDLLSMTLLNRRIPKYTL